jgi:hypothetical protein
MAESVSAKDRRRRPRVSLRGEVQGRIHTVALAPIIDLSHDGALLEVACSLHPGSVYALRLPLHDHGALTLKSRVIRSAVHGFEIKAGGESLLRYRTAVEFVEVSPEQRSVLEREIVALGGPFETEFDEGTS